MVFIILIRYACISWIIIIFFLPLDKNVRTITIYLVNLYRQNTDYLIDLLMECCLVEIIFIVKILFLLLSFLKTSLEYLFLIKQYFSDTERNHWNNTTCYLI